MALDKVLKIYDENGNPVDYDILAKDVKFLPDGKDLPTKLAELEDEIGEGGYTPPVGGIPKTDLAPDVQTSLGKADTALQSADKSELQTAITSLQNALNTLIGSGNVQGAIDTFNEVTAFLDGIDTDDPTLANQLLALNNAISAVQTSLAAKANSADVYSKSEVDTKVADAGKVKSVTINGTNHLPNESTGIVDLGTVVGEKGEKGETGSVVVSDGVAQIGIINDLTTGGTGDALSAEMGKRLGAQVGALEDAVEEMEDGAGYDISIVGQQLVITSRNRPSVNVGEVSNHNVACKAGNTATASFYVSGRKLSSAIQIAVSDATNWQVSPASISPVDGKVALTLVTITYRPAAGTASGTTHTCNVTVTCGGVTYGTIAMQGTVAAAPSITLTPASLNISTTSGTPATATVNVKGSALEGDIALAISGTGFTLSQNTVAKADAESAAGADVTVTFDGSAAGTATITATATGATAVNVEVNGSVVGRKAAGESWDGSNGMLTYTVLDDTSTVSVKQKSKTTCTGAITIPASVNDDNGIGYRVIMVADQGFYQNTNITSVVMRDGGIEILGSGAFNECTSLSSMTLPNTLKYIGNPSSSGYQNVIQGTQLTRLALPASLEKIFAYGIDENASLTELEIKGMPANSSGGEIFNHAIKANLVTVYTDIALKSTDDPLTVLPKITLASWGGSFLYGTVDGDSNTWNIYKDGNGVNQKITLVVPDDESVTAYNALRDKSGIGNVKGWGFFNIIKKSN